MASFQYEVVDSNGRTFRGRIEADNEAAARSRLSEMHYYVVGLKESRKGGDLGAWWVEHVQKVKAQELVAFTRQFATMVNAGVGLIRCLDILGTQTKDKKLASVLNAARRDVAAGTSLTEAFSKHPKVFSRLYISMLRSAEAGGILDEVLARLADYQENQLELKGKVKSAMMYPTVVLVFAIAVINVLVFLILPTFSRIFEEMGIDLPATTQLLLGTSHFLVQHWYLLPAALLGLGVGYRAYSTSPTGRRALDALKLRLPIAGDIILKIAVARFTRTFGTLTRSGLPVLRALEIVTDTTGNQVISEAINSARTSVREGDKISDPLIVTGIFPPMVTQMIAIGEETGSLDQMLMKIADFYEAEVDRTLKGLASLIEPLMIVGLGLLVAFVAISVISPIYELVGSAEKL